MRRRSDRIRNWMLEILSTGGIQRFDDLHIDDIDAHWRDRSSWISGSIEALRLAVGIRNEIAPDKVLALGVSLNSDIHDLPPPDTIERLLTQMDWAPPSLYLFAAGDEPWADASAYITIHKVNPDLFEDAWECFYLEFRADSGDLRRSFFARA